MFVEDVEKKAPYGQSSLKVEGSSLATAGRTLWWSRSSDIKEVSDKREKPIKFHERKWTGACMFVITVGKIKYAIFFGNYLTLNSYPIAFFSRNQSGCFALCSFQQASHKKTVWGNETETFPAIWHNIRCEMIKRQSISLQHPTFYFQSVMMMLGVDQGCW